MATPSRGSSVINGHLRNRRHRCLEVGKTSCSVEVKQYRATASHHSSLNSRGNTGTPRASRELVRMSHRLWCASSSTIRSCFSAPASHYSAAYAPFFRTPFIQPTIASDSSIIGAPDSCKVANQRAQLMSTYGVFFGVLAISLPNAPIFTASRASLAKHRF